MAQPTEARPTGTYPRQEVSDAVDFLKEIRYSLSPVKKDAFFNLFAGFVNGATTDVQHVVARAEKLLEGHPRLIAQFYALVDPEHHATRFLERVKSSLSQQDYDQFLAKLHYVDEERNLDAHHVYESFKPLFANKHDDLLQGLAEFLPAKYGPPPPHAGADAPESGRPRRAKKPRVDGDGLTLDPVCYAADAGAAGSSRPRRAHKPRIDADDEPTPKPAGCAADGAGAAGGSRPSRAKKPRVDGDEPAPKPACYAADDAGAAGRSRPSRAKKPRFDGDAPTPKPACYADDDTGAAGRSRPSRAKKPHVDGDAPTPKRAGYVAAAPDPKHRATEPDDEVREVKRFRKAWEFETRYSVLVQTLRRAMRLQRKKSRGSLEELFPRRESREYLAKLYDHRWEEMQERLTKDNGTHTNRALRAIAERLEREEEARVDEARRRRDPIRAAQRLHDLVRDIVREEREREGKARERRRSP
ncbi:hypothetical protein BS78_04G285100 [Paspalum vaginatum]|nr:hypothetical protein BS78_04G285100 [Paspalum vaginatum]